MHGVAANHSELLYHVTTTSLYVIAKMDVVVESVNNKQFTQLSTASLVDAYHNESTGGGAGLVSATTALRRLDPFEYSF